MSNHDDGNYGVELDDGWLCSCGHYNDHDFHCDECLNQPPWGCDCDSCSELDEKLDEQNELADADCWYDEEFGCPDHEPDWRV